jgi:hypothetical protein
MITPMKHIRLILLACVAMTTVSCEKIFFEEAAVSKDARKNFEYLWNECDRKYAFFSYKNIDWNEVHDRYSAQVKDGMPEDALFKVLANMLNELKDGHVNLVSSFNVSRYEFNRNGPKTYNDRLIRDRYLTDSFYSTGPFIHDFLQGKTALAYVRLNSFTGTVSDFQLDLMLNRYRNTRGLILDLRNNGGGAVTDVFKILSRFVEKETYVYDVFLKNGPGHEDFGPRQETWISPHSGIRYTKKVVVLIDRGTFSAGSFTATAAKAISTMTLVGDSTGGGMGLPNGGQLPNGWTYRFSVTRSPDPRGRLYENGVPPDVYVKYDFVQELDGKDTMIETALGLL